MNGCWAAPLSGGQRAELAGLLARASRKAWAASRVSRIRGDGLALPLAETSAEMSALRADLTGRGAAP